MTDFTGHGHDEDPVRTRSYLMGNFSWMIDAGLRIRFHCSQKVVGRVYRDWPGGLVRQHFPTIDSKFVLCLKH